MLDVRVSDALLQSVRFAEISSISESTLDQLRYQRVQMAQTDGVRWAYELLFVAWTQKGAVTTRKDKTRFCHVQH